MIVVDMSGIRRCGYCQKHVLNAIFQTGIHPQRNPQMKETKPVEAIERLCQRVKNGETITLLCYIRPEDHCHRNIIKSLIEGNTSKVEKNIKHFKRG